MYCKQCGKNYPKSKRLCKDCGIALVQGTSPESKKTKIKKDAIISACVAAVVVVAVFLIIGLTGMVPSDVKGTWYETSGYGGIMEFEPNGVLGVTAMGELSKGTYTYDSALKQGEISVALFTDEQTDLEFTFDDSKIEMDGMTYTNQYVEQINLNDMFKDIVDGLENK